MDMKQSTPLHKHDKYMRGCKTNREICERIYADVASKAITYVQAYQIADDIYVDDVFTSIVMEKEPSTK